MELSFDTVDHGNGFDFGRAAADYAKYRDIYPASLYRKLEETGAVRAGLRVLDAGTGTGVLPRAMYGTGARFTGIDLSPEQIEAARALSAGKAIEYRVSPAESTPFPARSFDTVTACQCIRYFDPERFSAELARIMVPGGLLAVVHMNWLPHEDPVARMSEEVILACNPAWTGGGFRPSPLREYGPAKERFTRQAAFAWREALPFSIDSWAGRLRSCRGLGASLPPERVAAFERQLRTRLAGEAGERFTVLHYVEIELHRLNGVRGL